MSLIEEWRLLDRNHRKFIIQAHNSNGAKHYCETSVDTDEVSHVDCDGYTMYKRIYLYELAEESGFTECVGSYKWRSTAKFKELYETLFYGDL